MKTIHIKIYFKIILLIFVLIGTGSCSNDWLDPKPLSLFTPESILNDAGGINGLLGYCEKVERSQYYADDVNPIITEMIFTEVAVQGQTLRLGPAQNLDQSITPTSELNHGKFNRIGWFWAEFYKVIKTANIVISRINDVEFDNEEEKNAALGSAYFHRAYCYYRLVHQFGDVPYIGTEISSPKLDIYSTEREVILESIKKDMEFAVKNCSDNVARGHATKGAAYHLLTKINLALGNFDDAIASATAVIEGGVYHLMTTKFGAIAAEEGDYIRQDMGITRNDVTASLHWPPNKALAENREVLYVGISRDELAAVRDPTASMRNMVPFWGGTSPHMIFTPDGKAPSMSTARNEEFELLETFGRGVGNCRPTNYYQYTIWDDANDQRHKKGNWMKMEDLVYNNAQNLKGESDYYGKHLQFRNDDGQALTSDSIMYWFNWPHYKSFGPSPLEATPTGGGNDMYIYRLAETYLLRAEAYWWKDNLQKAMADVNTVRARAECAPYMDEGNFDIGTILDERARELYYEEPRKTELTRMSFLFAKTGKSYRGKSYSLSNFGDDNFLFDRVTQFNNFYNHGIVNISGTEYKISPYHVLWPVPQQAISANVKGRINQNYGYSGYENNEPPLTEIIVEEQ